MRNEFKPKIRKIISLAERLPFFSFDDLVSVEKDRIYLKILFSRYVKSKKLIRLKKGIYTTREYVDNLQKSRLFSFYPEFIAVILYQPSYLSLEYVLYQHNLLTEVTQNFTSVAKNKTAHFLNEFGTFFYHKIKDELFCGFEIVEENGFIIYKATKAKALFDYLYLRKNILINKKTVEELRLNINNLNKKDKSEFKKYIRLEGSKKMKEIFDYLLE